MDEFDIIAYMDSMTGYNIPSEALRTIARDRNVLGVTDAAMLSLRDKDLMRADMLFYIYTSPTQTASIQKQHGAWNQSVGSQIINDKRNIYRYMMSLYRRWGDPRGELLDDGCVQWIEE